MARADGDPRAGAGRVGLASGSLPGRLCGSALGLGAGPTDPLPGGSRGRLGAAGRQRAAPRLFGRGQALRAGCRPGSGDASGRRPHPPGRSARGRPRASDGPRPAGPLVRLPDALRAGRGLAGVARRARRAAPAGRRGSGGRRRRARTGKQRGPPRAQPELGRDRRAAGDLEPSRRFPAVSAGILERSALGGEPRSARLRLPRWIRPPGAGSPAGRRRFPAAAARALLGRALAAGGAPRIRLRRRRVAPVSLRPSPPALRRAEHAPTGGRGSGLDGHRRLALGRAPRVGPREDPRAPLRGSGAGGGAARGRLGTAGAARGPPSGIPAGAGRSARDAHGDRPPRRRGRSHLRLLRRRAGFPLLPTPPRPVGALRSPGASRTLPLLRGCRGVPRTGPRLGPLLARLCPRRPGRGADSGRMSRALGPAAASPALPARGALPLRSQRRRIPPATRA